MMPVDLMSAQPHYRCMRYLMLFGFIAACSEKRGGTTFQDVERDTKKAVETTAAFVNDTATQTRDDYLKAANARLADIDQRTAALKRDLAGRNEQAKKESEAQIQALEAKRAELAAEIAQVKNDTGDAWRETRRKADATADAFEKSYADLRRRLSKI
jgi:chorismate mutase